MKELICVFTLLLSGLIHPTLGSTGDKLKTYRDCLHLCTSTGCAQAVQNTYKCRHALACHESTRPFVPVSLQITGWGCKDDCRYLCMADVEHRRRLSGKPPSKYYGKWPFRRVLGMQEAASVLFSLANLCAHLYGLSYLLDKSSLLSSTPTEDQKNQDAAAAPSASSASALSQGRYPYMWLWLVYAGLHLNTWVWSAVFHTRDTRLTERLDYCSAITVIAAGLVVALARTLNLRSKTAAALLALAVASGLGIHLNYMLNVKFDYDWNVKVCATIGALSGLAWAVWVFTVARKQGHPGRYFMLAFLVLTNAAVLLEVLDFPPLFGPKDPDHSEMGLGLLDAHAMWHAATVPLTILFYRFIGTDLAWWYGKKHDD
ncbi:Per1-like-domain-containing protein [Dunaliella salina]|uniref:Post-GPI attachment to proteins factor 3 n=1 Tax=Dunaliella salina TaxID=3046 RepID=A0ABQ7G7Y5_DUNSA|nr:Per1-like-domain-containing protein [Dunaliella salina]|eukprot:KAF5830707.1 Per1-like-domain-containing protein [Dunaliella salina]